jgi:hypothetical protein
VIEDPTSYRLVPASGRADVHGGRRLHRLKITRHATARTLDATLPPDEIRERFALGHPVSTSVPIRDEGAGERLMWEMSARFGR